MNKYVKIDDWVKNIVVDPLGKESLTISDDEKFLITSYGKKYSIKDGIYDLRLLKTETTGDQRIWADGQKAYEEDTKTLISYDTYDSKSEIESISKVYQDIPIKGRCLDVGGNKGTLREFLNNDQEYISCDPFINVFNVGNIKNYLKHFSFSNEPMNFICCDAEYLPFKSSSFDTVHMRSVIDHFLNPESALLEAFRVLKKNGDLIVGLYVIGGKDGKESLKQKLKGLVKNLLPYLGIHKYTDHHTWHPTFQELSKLIIACGFKISKVHWQEGHDSVCYISATKKS